MWFLIVSLAFESQYAMGGKLIVSFSLCLMKNKLMRVGDFSI